MYKLVAIDIDGTLLNSSGELSNNTINTINKITQKGIKVVLTSGRISDSVKGIASMLQADHYIICDNGATIIDINKSDIAYARYLYKSTVIKIIDYCIKNNIYYMVFTNKEIIVKDLKHMAYAFYRQRHHLKDEASGMAEIHFAGMDYIKKVEEPFTRIIVCDEDRAIYNSIISSLKTFEDISLMVSPHISKKYFKDGQNDVFLSYSYAEILAKGTNKWTAILNLINYYDIKPSEVMAIGDNFNDIEMIKNAGLGVAMNNGSPVAKEVAQVIAPSNNDDGVAKVLERYVLYNNFAT